MILLIIKVCYKDSNNMLNSYNMKQVRFIYTHNYVV
jgi:hypothetical protein